MERSSLRRDVIGLAVGRTGCSPLPELSLADLRPWFWAKTERAAGFAHPAHELDAGRAG